VFKIRDSSAVVVQETSQNSLWDTSGKTEHCCFEKGVNPYFNEGINWGLIHPFCTPDRYTLSAHDIQMPDDLDSKLGKNDPNML
jgi:hypothetical protein